MSEEEFRARIKKLKARAKKRAAAMKSLKKMKLVVEQSRSESTKALKVVAKAAKSLKSVE